MGATSVKKLLFAAAVLLWGGQAHAGAITMTVTTTTNGYPCTASACTRTWTDTDANLANIATALGPACTAQNNNVTCTAQQVITYWFNSVIQRLTSEVNSQLYSQAVKAMAAPPTINPQ